jgi:hypothetical protein
MRLQQISNTFKFFGELGRNKQKPNIWSKKMKKCHINKRRKQKVKEKDWAITNNMTGRV